MRILLCLLALICGPLGAPCLAAADPPEPPRGLVADGPAFRGRLAAAQQQPEWTLRFDVSGQNHEVAVQNLVLWGALVEPARGIHVVLADGGMIVADNLKIEEERLRGAAPLLGTLDLPLTAISGIIYHPPLDQAKLDQLSARIATATGPSDRALLDNGDELTGNITELTATALALQTDGAKINVEIGQLTALVFNPSLVERPAPAGLRIIAGFADGSRAFATKFATEANSAKIRLAGGGELTAAIDSIVALQPLGGRAVYLSDLKPASYRHIPYLQLSWPLKLDRSALGSLMRAGGNLYAKGLGMHSPARVTYNLDRPYRRLEADVAVDSESGDRGSVVFRVFVDEGTGKWREAAASETLRGGDRPVPITVELAGVKRISLLVDFADYADEQDHADWLNARLIR
jgi:hypothetical protein